MGGRREKARRGGGGVDGDAPSVTPDPPAAPAPLAASPVAVASVAAAPVAATCVVTITTGAAAAVYDEK